ncbi:hypothetical protein ACFL0T_07605 [Candidatus Omnitrophota bacterium]
MSKKITTIIITLAFAINSTSTGYLPSAALAKEDALRPAAFMNSPGGEESSSAGTNAVASDYAKQSAAWTARWKKLVLSAGDYKEFVVPALPQVANLFTQLARERIKTLLSNGAERVHVLDLGGAPLYYAAILRQDFSRSVCPISVVDCAQLPKRAHQAAQFPQYMRMRAEDLTLQRLGKKADFVYSVTAFDYMDKSAVLGKLHPLTSDTAEFIFVLHHPKSVIARDVARTKNELTAKLIIYELMAAYKEGSIEAWDIRAQYHEALKRDIFIKFGKGALTSQQVADIDKLFEIQLNHAFAIMPSHYNGPAYFRRIARVCKNRLMELEFTQPCIDHLFSTKKDVVSFFDEHGFDARVTVFYSNATAHPKDEPKYKPFCYIVSFIKKGRGRKPPKLVFPAWASRQSKSSSAGNASLKMPGEPTQALKRLASAAIKNARVFELIASAA